MSADTSAYLMIGLDSMMIIYTLWVVSIGTLGKPLFGIGLGLFIWLGLLHLGLSTQSIFPQDISGIAFLSIIFIAVGAVGALLFFIPPVRRVLLSLSQEQLLLLQGIRVLFGASFLTQASLGVLPAEFGIVDGWTHISAGFLALVAAFTLLKGENGIRRAQFANLFGLLDILIVASTLSLLLLPNITPHHSMMYAVFLPAPLWLWFHLVSIWKLLHPGQVTPNKLAIA
ncbi:MAG: hypothetical protein PHH47_00525 [Gallionella sp.]|nr:hypothetical protein [Gallionella sp.]MDD4946891.1 hypothetical protein [Gallionella sp.]